MKTTLLFTVFVLAFAFVTAREVMVDTDGDFIRNYGVYYILPALQGNGGPVSLEATGNQSCPLTVVQALSELAHGWPTRISAQHRLYYLGTDEYIDFTAESPPYCAARSWPRWTIDEEENGTKQVKLVEKESELRVRDLFRIQKYHGATYTIEYCSSFEGPCTTLGVDKALKRSRPLLVSDDVDPFVFVFSKVEPSAESRAYH